MLRFPLLRPEPRLGEPMAAEVRVAGGQADGEFSWPHDPFFRPLVGFYVAGRLQTLATTTRRVRNGRWRCYFSLEVPEGEPGMIACVETGEVMWPTPEPRGTVLTVEDIVAKGRDASRRDAWSGFPSFLMLPLTDQISIMHRDFLGRDPTSEEVTTWRTRLLKDGLSILDLRDELATGDDVFERLITVDDRCGALCLWPGFKDVLVHLVPKGEKAGSGSFQPAVAETGRDPGGLLALTAVGGGQQPGLYLEWIQAHQKDLGQFAGRITPSRKRRERHYRTGNLLPLMTCGPGAVRRDDSCIEATRSGVVVYGPYMMVEVGHHKVEIVCQAGQPSSRFAVEVVHGDVLLARRDFQLERDGRHSRSVEFTLPKGLAEIAETPEIEFRVTGDAALTVESVRLCVHGGAAGNAILELGSLSPGDAGLRTAGDTISSVSGAGRVFYGPYCRLLPGAYQFSLECRAEESGEIDLEAVAANTEILARLRMALMPGSNRIRLPFALPRIDDEAFLAGPIEFRLGKGHGFVLTCASARLLRESDGGPGLLD